MSTERRELVDQILAQENLDQALGSDNRVFWFLEDHQQTTRDLVNNAGKLVAHYVYDAFGEVVAGDTSRTRYLYTGRELDSATGLQYNHHRWYDPHTGRWISEDPIEIEGGDYNFTRYVGNMATYARDPSGLETFSIGLQFDVSAGPVHISGSVTGNFGYSAANGFTSAFGGTLEGGAGTGLGIGGGAYFQGTNAPSVGSLEGHSSSGGIVTPVIGGSYIEGDQKKYGGGPAYRGIGISVGVGPIIGVFMDNQETDLLEWSKTGDQSGPETTPHECPDKRCGDGRQILRQGP